MMQITDDTPPDMLAGTMNLNIQLPDGTSTKMSFERRTPMMDVLVQITNANHLQISAHTLQPLAIVSDGSSELILQFLPSTPIGTLDTREIRVSVKNHRLPTNKRKEQKVRKPFETTFRLKVHLPRNQLYVDRVSPGTPLEEIMRKVCEEKNLDAKKYEFRHPNHFDQVLDLNRKLNDYDINEVHVFPKGSVNSEVFTSSDSLMEFQKPKKTPIGTGLLNFFKRTSKISHNNNESGSVSSDTRSISPTQSDDQNVVDKPKVPTRKRRPAPKPPLSSPSEDAAEECSNNPLVISHSRNSSDSSGYHESSVLSDTGPGTLTRKVNHKMGSNLLMAMKVHSKSTSNISTTGRKKKAAPPPPSASGFRKSATCVTLSDPVSNIASPAPSSTVVASPIQDEVIEEVCKNPVIDGLQTPPVEEVDAFSSKVEIEEKEFEWQYHLPSPPKAFRDVTPPPSDDRPQQSTVLTSPDLLLEKLNEIKTSTPASVSVSVSVVDSTEALSTQSTEETTFLGNLSLENLEKRRSLVYNRELATSFKVEESPPPPPVEEASKSTMIDELSKVLTTNTKNTLKRNDGNNNDTNFSTTLPNFKITTYEKDAQKKVVNIFEDDSIRSNHSMTLLRNQRTNHFTKMDSVHRSESMSSSAWYPNVPIKRSKSQITLNSHNRSPTGLQSLEILKAIQTKLTAAESVSETSENSAPKEKAKEKPPNVPGVIIKIAGPGDDSMQRFIHHTTASAYRKPIEEKNSLKKVHKEQARLPIVRSVELKKTFRPESTCIYLNGGADAGRSNKEETNANGSNLNQRDDLLSAIRNFGGRKGLKSVKVQ